MKTHIEDFSPISKLDKLEDLHINDIFINDISFLENNRNLKKLNLNNCYNIRDFMPISKFDKLEIFHF